LGLFWAQKAAPSTVKATQALRNKRIAKANRTDFQLQLSSCIWLQMQAGLRPRGNQALQSDGEPL
jgi:hypothetical protein